MAVLTGFALVVIAVLLFELIIFVHELGHFISAKKSGVQVNEFALGMGPKIFSFKKGETQYSLRLFPIGGYCSMEAEDSESDNPRAFTNAKIWKRMIIIIAGAVMNILLGFILMFAIVVQSDSFASTTIDSFSPRSYSANCGLKKGDKIVKLNNYDIINSRDFSFAVSTIECKEYNGDSLNIYKQDCANALCDLFAEIYNKGSSTDKEIEMLNKILIEGTDKINATNSKEKAELFMKKYYADMQAVVRVENYKFPEIEVKEKRQRYRTDATVIRNGETVELKNVDLFTFIKDKNDEKPSVSIDFYVTQIDKTFLTVLQQTGEQTISTVRMVWASLIGLITGQFGINEVSGPVGVASAITEVASVGLESSFLDAVNNIVNVMMVITVNLGIFNMLPFPALDGGRFFFLLIEAIFRKPIPRKFEYFVNAIGLGILLLFSLLITLKDVWTLLPF